MRLTINNGRDGRMPTRCENAARRFHDFSFSHFWKCSHSSRNFPFEKFENREKWDFSGREARFKVSFLKKITRRIEIYYFVTRCTRGWTRREFYESAKFGRIDNASARIDRETWFINVHVVVQCRCDVIVESAGRSHELSNLLLTWKLRHVVVQRWTSISRFPKVRWLSKTLFCLIECDRGEGVKKKKKINLARDCKKFIFGRGSSSFGG